MAYIALFVALGGSSYAAIRVTSKNVPKDALTGADIKNLTGRDVRNNSLTGADVKNLTSGDVANGRLLAEDFAAGQLPKGETGKTGPAGRSALESLRSGETIRGLVGGDFQSQSTSDDFGVAGQLPIPAPQGVTSANADVDGLDEVGNRCTGTGSNPTAPPGVVCIYVTGSTNATSVLGEGVGGVGGSRFGFEVIWSATAMGDTLLFATWAYQAP